jgi:hypothetical protein
VRSLISASSFRLVHTGVDAGVLSHAAPLRSALQTVACFALLWFDLTFVRCGESHTLMITVAEMQMWPDNLIGP